MPLQNLYFIAILTPEDISKDVTSFRMDFAKNYNSKAALKNMPHITLKAPFKLEASGHGQLIEWFSNIPVFVSSFTTELKDFGTFDNPKNPVVFVNPVITDDLKNLQTEIITDFEKHYPEITVSYIEKKFRPHMTIAYRDLQQDEYQKAWPVYKTKKYRAMFQTNSFCLLQHDTRQWNVIAEHQLK